MRSPTGIEDEAGQRGVVRDAAELHPHAPQHEPVVLDVVARFRDGGVREEIAQRGERRAPERRQVHRRDIAGELAVGSDVAERQVPRPSGCHGQRQSDQLGAHRVEGRGLDVDRDDRRAPALRDHRAESRGILDDARRRAGGRRSGGRRGGRRCRTRRRRGSAQV